MPRLGEFYKDESGHHETEHYQDIPGVDKETVEKLVPHPKWDDPIPVRIVQDAVPKQSIVKAHATRVIVPLGRTIKIVGYKANRKNVNIFNEAVAESVLLSDTNELADYLGRTLPGQKDVDWPGAFDIYAHNPITNTSDITLSLLTELVIEIERD